MRRRNTSGTDADHNSGYFSRESGSVKKRWKDRLPIALVFPNSYAVGMSNLGLQTVYGILNDHPDIVAERFFADGSRPPLSIESSRPLRDFPLILTSISFEPDYLQLIKMLLRAGIPPLSDDRNINSLFSLKSGKDCQPLIIAGGVASFINPDPLTPFVDLFVLGEAEPQLPGIITYLLKKINRIKKRTLLKNLSLRFPGCFAPIFYKFTYQDEKLINIKPAKGLPKHIKKINMPLSAAAANHSQIMAPDAEFSNIFLAELGRGCSRGCRFCAAGFVYRPPRLWPAASIIKAISQRDKKTDRVGLLGMEMISPKDLDRISEYLAANSCSLTFSSLRADMISPTLLKVLTKSGLKSATIAPDGGSERLRKVINKNLSEDELLTAAASLTKAGISNLKLYFMIGLPTERWEDIDELIDLTLKIKRQVLAKSRAKGRLGKITLSINCFIPKPWTPFQYHPFESLSLLRDKMKYLRKKLSKVPNIVLKAEKPGNAFYQAVLARGDRALGKVLLHMAQTGKTWQQAMKALGISPDDYVYQQRDKDELFPWDIIDHGIKKDYLWAEYQKALKGKTTVACDTKKCRRCGVCIDI